MVEASSETDEQLLEKYLSGEEVTNDELKAALRRATISDQVQPVICGSAYKNTGVQPLLDAEVDFLPSLLDAHQQVRGEQRGVGGRHRRGGGPQERHHRRHDLRSQAPRGAGVDE